MTAALAASLAGCAAPQSEAPVRGALTAIGTPAQGAPISAWRSGWMKEFPETSLNYSPDGARVGMDALLTGQAYFAATDTPLANEDVQKSKDACGPDGAFSVPVAVIPIGVMFNLPSIKNLKLNAGTLSGIFSGRITNWEDPEIARLNPESEFPDQDIVPIRAEEASPLTAAVTDYLSPAGWPARVDRNWPETAGGVSVKKYDAVPRKVDDTAGSIAFVDRAGIGPGFDTALLDFGTGFVRMSDDSLSKSIAAGATGTGPGESVTFAVDPTAASGYGLATVTYQTYCSSYANPSLTKLVKSWGNYVLSGGGQGNSARFAGVATLSEKALKMAKSRIDDISTVE